MKEKLLSFTAVGIAAVSIGLTVLKNQQLDVLQKRVDTLQQNIDANFVADCRNEMLLRAALKIPVGGIDECKQERIIWLKEAKEKGTIDISK